MRVIRKLGQKSNNTAELNFNSLNGLTRLVNV
jgi:hypothetical protein